MLWQLVVIATALVLPVDGSAAASAESSPPPSTRPTIVVHGVCRGTEPSVIDPGGAALLDETIAMLKDAESAVIVEQDAGGGAHAYDRSCALKCADAVQAYLLNHGVASDRFSVEVPDESDGSGVTARSGVPQRCAGTN